MRRFLLVLAGLFAAMFAFAAAAAAHVTVSATGATPGGSDALITFRVPVEKEVPTTGFTVVLPTDTPIASVEVAATPGWTHTEKTTTLTKPITTDDGKITTAVSQITWTAKAGQGLTPGEFGEFTVLAGQLPDTSSITFKALQTYSDGSVVRWIETAAPGSKDEPEHPAPVLTLTEQDKPAAAPSNTGPVVLSIVALVVAAAALGLVLVRRART